MVQIPELSVLHDGEDVMGPLTSSWPGSRVREYSGGRLSLLLSESLILGRTWFQEVTFPS